MNVRKVPEPWSQESARLNDGGGRGGDSVTRSLHGVVLHVIIDSDKTGFLPQEIVHWTLRHVYAGILHPCRMHVSARSRRTYGICKLCYIDKHVCDALVALKLKNDQGRALPPEQYVFREARL